MPAKTSKYRRRKVPDRVGVSNEILPQAEFPTFLQRLDAYSGDKTIKIALRLIIITMVRTVELRAALAGIRFQPQRLVQPRRAHEDARATTDAAIAPVAGVARRVEGHHRLLRSHVSGPLQPRTTHQRKHAALRPIRMVYHSRATTHGFRALASTILNESVN